MTTANLPGHPYIEYKNDELHMESVNLKRLARKHGTPLFVYSKNSMLSSLAAYQRGFLGRNVQICYAMKANPSLGVLQVFAEAGCGFDIVSVGDMERALAAGGRPEKIIFSGVGKTRLEMKCALDAGIGCFNVESEAELEALNEVAISMKKIAPVSIRVNPDVDPKTHPYISTGLKNNKFGVAHDSVLKTYQRASSLPGIHIQGIDCHIGSQITDEKPYLDTIDKMLDLVEEIEALGIKLSHIDFGGGLGINYRDETPPVADDLWIKLLNKLDSRGFGQRKFMIEPGRSLVGNAGVCLAEVIYLKPGVEKNFCIIDAAMNDLPRPSMYQAFHQIIPLENRGAPASIWDVVGPICESGDWIGHDRSLSVKPGDLLAVLSAGAYCMSMSSNYNSRGRATEVLVDGLRCDVIRKREDIKDQIRNEFMVSR